MTILIKNAQLIDGTGRAPVKADVLIKRKKIAAIGHFPRYKANLTIDSRGGYLAPGLIDIHSCADRYLKIFGDAREEEGIKELLMQGVTTIIGGQDGLSLAPALYGSLGAMREWVDVRRVNVNWHTVGEFLKTLRRKLFVNYGTLVGYWTVREALIGEEERIFAPNEVRVFKFFLERALKEGAFGLSIGPEDLRDEIAFSEMKEILDTVARFKGVYATELYGLKDEKMSALHRTINQIEDSGARVIINHLGPSRSLGREYEKILELIDSVSARVDICFEIYPADFEVLPICCILPRWFTGDKIIFGAPNKKSDQLLIQLKDGGTRERVIKELPVLRGDSFIVSAPGHKYLEGMTLKRFTQNRNFTLFTGLLNLLELTRGRAIIGLKNISQKAFWRQMRHGRAIIASADRHLKEIPSGVFPQLLEYIEKEKNFPLEGIIYKLTAFPAAQLGLKDRGVVRPGYAADLVLFRDGKTEEVILNGQRVVAEGKFQNLRAGEVLKHGIK